MMNQKRWKVVAAAAGAAVLVALLVTWRVSKGRARERAADLLTASADMVRCVAGDGAEIEARAAEHGFRRRLVNTLPDISTVSDCPQALETVQEKLAAHAAVWFASKGSPAAERVRAAVAGLADTPYVTPANKVLGKRDPQAPLLKLPRLSMDLFSAAEELLAREGASAEDVARARERRFREARKAPARAPAPKPVVTLPGRLAPERWALSVADRTRAMIWAQTDKSVGLVATTRDAAATFASATGGAPLAGKTDASMWGMWAPGPDPWVAVSWTEPDKKVRVGAAKLPHGATSLPAVVPVPPPPAEWARAAGAEREIAVLSGGTVAYAVTKIVDKPKKLKKDDEKRRKEWQKHLEEKQVQMDMILEDARAKRREAAGIDDDHMRVDGIAYQAQGKGETTAREVGGYAVAALVAGPEPTMLLGKDELPALEMHAGPVLGPDELMGPLAIATAPKPVMPMFRTSHWYRCAAHDGFAYGFTEHGSQMIGIKPGAIELTNMIAEAPEASHVGCGESSVIIALPFNPDRIFANVFTVRGGEIEGSKVATTSGTHIDEYNATVATGLVQGAIVVAWVAEGYVNAVVSRNWGTEFGAPTILGEVNLDGSRVSGVHLAGMGSRLVMVLARESCEAGGSCTTGLEVLVSDDQAKSWRAPE